MPGEQLLILSNPRGQRGRRRDAKGRFLKRGSRASNPRSASHSKTKKKRKGRSRSDLISSVAWRASPYRRNPRGGFLSVVTDGAVPAAIGASGALAADFMLSFVPLPERVKAGAMRHVSRAAAAVLLGGVASYFVKPAMALQIGTGALTVAFHGAFRDVLARMLPANISARLGDYDEMDLSALGIYSSGPVEEPDLAAFESRLAQADDDGMAAFEQTMNGLGDTIEI